MRFQVTWGIWPNYLQLSPVLYLTHRILISVFTFPTISHIFHYFSILLIIVSCFFPWFSMISRISNTYSTFFPGIWVCCVAQVSTSQHTSQPASRPLPDVETGLAAATAVTERCGLGLPHGTQKDAPKKRIQDGIQMYTVDDVICPEFSAFQRLFPAFIFWGGGARYDLWHGCSSLLKVWRGYQIQWLIMFPKKWHYAAIRCGIPATLLAN